jgi:fibronectin-binding autotransporter adhesin
VLKQNQANGGHNNTASGTGTLLAGVGVGGGIFNYLGNYNSPGYGSLDASVVTVSGSLIDQNQADGGGDGNGEGGGIANLLSATTTVTGSTITQNEANGGRGGAGLGGGAFNDATSTLELYDALVTQNQANGSPGIGGGIYTVGTFTYDSLTVIKNNHASTSGNNIGP